MPIEQISNARALVPNAVTPPIVAARPAVLISAAEVPAITPALAAPACCNPLNVALVPFFRVSAAFFKKDLG